MPRKVVNGKIDGKVIKLKDDEIAYSPNISQEQLNHAKVFSSREEYVKHLKKNIDYMEIGVAWGYYSELVIEHANPNTVYLLDEYDQDLKCWSWRKFGSCQCSGMKHELLYTPETHEQYIKDKFLFHNNVKTVKGDCEKTLKNIEQKFDYIYIDTYNGRSHIDNVLSLASDIVKVGGIVGLNDYLIYDGIIEDRPYGTFQAVNDFLFNNINWSVDAIALHAVGFYDIYLKKNKY